MPTILVVDDDMGTRFFLREMLQQEGYQVVLAADGQQALARLNEGWCDLVMMDIQMPVLDGYQATRRIKAMKWEGRVLPVIFLTSVESDRELARCLECGGDDFLTKPPNPIILKARIHAWLQRADLANQLAQDRHDVENVILKMREDGHFDPRGLRVLMTPMEKTNGDLVLSACRSDGVQHIVVGDFTGHGLTAAVCGPLVADIFYRMTGQNRPLREILVQVNEAVYGKLPTHMFLAATFLEMDRAGGRIRLWNAGLPGVVLFRSGRLANRFPSCFPPLGIRRSFADQGEGTQHSLLAGDRIFLFSDGVIETRAPTGEFFGEKRLVCFLEELLASGAGLEGVLPVLEEFRAGEESLDDVTLVETTG